jgi:hypothetical protein
LKGTTAITIKNVLIWFRNLGTPNFAVQEDLAEMAFDVRGKSRANNLLFRGGTAELIERAIKIPQQEYIS